MAGKSYRILDERDSEKQEQENLSFKTNILAIKNDIKEVNTQFNTINNKISNFDTTIQDVNADISVIESRVNNLTKMNEGSTTGDAELSDIRVGADGVTYDTAGEAVRTQIAALNEVTEIKLVEETTDWDAITETGTYIVLAGANGTGKPTTVNQWSTSGTLRVEAHSNGVVVQEYAQTYTNNVYRRLMTSGVWKAWASDEVSLAVLPTSSDLNDLRNNQRYLTVTGNTYSNFPPTMGNSTIGLVETYEYKETSASGILYQIYTDFNKGDVFTRIATKSGSSWVWRAWKFNIHHKFSILPDGSDLNDLSECTYCGDNSMTYTNFPPTKDQVGLIETFDVVGSVLKYQRFTQWRTGDIFYRLNLQAGWGAWFKKNDLKKEISILFVGNSLTQDGIAYLPYVLKNYFPEVSFKFYMWYNGGRTLAQHYEYFINDTACEIFSVAENKANWTNTSKTMSSILSTYKFDIVCMQEYLNYKVSFTEENLVDWNNCADYIINNYTGGNPLKFVQLFHAPKRDSADSIYEVTKTANEVILKNTVSEDMIGTGIAVYNALSTDLDDLGDQGHLSPDGTHTQEGLPCLIQTYVAAMWVLEKLGIPKSIHGCPLRMTSDIYSSINVPGANLGTGVIVGTDEQNILAQKIAIQAYKESKQMVLNIKNTEGGSQSGTTEGNVDVTEINEKITSLQNTDTRLNEDIEEVRQTANSALEKAEEALTKNESIDNVTQIANSALDKAEQALARNEFTDEDKAKLDSMTGDVDLSDYYNKTQVDSKISTLNSDISSVNSKASQNEADIAENASQISTLSENLDDACNNISNVKTVIGYTQKNLLKNTGVDTTLNKVTYTNNNDGSVTVTGTVATPGNSSNNFAENITIEPGEYIFTGDDSIKSRGYGELRIYVGSTIYRTGTVITFTEPTTITKALVFIFSGKNLNGSKTVYPMLRRADDTDDTYQPYVDNVDTRLKELLARIEALEALSQ